LLPYYYLLFLKDLPVILFRDPRAAILTLNKNLQKAAYDLEN
jgi:hypothetical protein